MRRGLTFLAGCAAISLGMGLAAAGPVTLKPIWQVKGDASQLGVHDGVVVRLNSDGVLTGHDAETGDVLWDTAKSNSPKGAYMAMVGGTAVLSREGTAKLEARTVRDGRLSWVHPLTTPPTSLVACDTYRAVVATHRHPDETGAPTLMAHAIDPEDGRSLWRVPVAERLVGAGGGYVFAGHPSDFGLNKSGLQAIRCADGARFDLPSTQRPYVRLLWAGEGRAVTLGYYAGFKREVVCVTEIGARTSTCLSAEELGQGQRQIRGAALLGDRLYVSSANKMARNLDPHPDGAIHIYDLKAGARVGQSPPDTGGHALLTWGGALLTGYGSTGTDDFVHVLNPDGVAMGSLKVDSTPGPFAVDATRAYFGTYRGKLYAVPLPVAGPTPISAAKVTPQDLPSAPQPAISPWKVVRTFKAHPAKARSSGSMGSGDVNAIGFVDEAGELLAVGGNDDRVRIMRTTDGRRLWRSKRLGNKDVQKLKSCAGGRFAAQIYGGDIFVFQATKSGKRVKTLRRIKNGHGWGLNLSANCKRVAADNFSDELKIYSAAKGRTLATFPLPRRFDARGLRAHGDLLAIPQQDQGGVVVLDLAAKVPGPMGPTQAIDATREGRKLVQILPLSPTKLLLEYCGGGACELVINGEAISFDIRGGVWSPSVPSTLALSPDARWLVFFRRGLQPQIIDLVAGHRFPLGGSTNWQVPAFSPNSRRLAVGQYDRSNTVTILELTPSAAQK